MTQGFQQISAPTSQLALSAPQPQEKPQPATERKHVKLGPRHKEHLAWMHGKGYGDWDEQAHGLNTHTKHVEEMCAHFELPGEFAHESATGKDGPSGRNCILFPLERGLWMCVLYGGATGGPGWKMSKYGHATRIVGKAPPKAKIDPADTIVDDALATDTFFHWEGVAYVQVNRNGKTENLLVAGDSYARLLRVRYRNQYKKVAKREWIGTAVEQLVATAIEEGEEIPVYVRVAYVNSRLYVDLADKKGNIIEIDKEDWRPIKDAPVRFLRSEKMQPLPMPERGGSLQDLRPFLNVEDEDFPLLIGTILGMLHPTGPYPVLLLIGGDGRAKTCTATIILMLIDPSIVKGCAPPDKAEDLMLSVLQRWIYFVDNLSEIRPWLSDACCRLSTGSAMERRTLYKNQDTSVFCAKRPQLFTSVRDVVTAPDLNSRTIKLDLPQVANRKTEAELWAEFELARPKILGALYTAVSAALRNLPTTKVAALPRLADFALWCQAAEPATGLDEGVILRTYAEARETQLDDLLTADVAQRLIAFATSKEWRGTGRELAEVLNVPRTTNEEVKGFVGQLRDLQTALESKGVLVSFKKSNGRKLITIKAQPSTAAHN